MAFPSDDLGDGRINTPAAQVYTILAVNIQMLGRFARYCAHIRGIRLTRAELLDRQWLLAKTPG